jgi:ABC-type lipoprotein export system ATPase subunit
MVNAADEPTGNLDDENTRAVMDLLLYLAHNEGKISLPLQMEVGLPIN